MVDFFGYDKRLEKITEGDIDDWRRQLASRRENGSLPEENTVRKHIAIANVFFGAAKRKS